jgi:hypothetical protein
MARGALWTDEEIDILRGHPDITAQAMHSAYLPNRTPAAIGVMRDRLREREVRPVVRSPGVYPEVLAGLLVDDDECMKIWAKWNGYASWDVVSRDSLGWCTLACTAIGI